MKTLLPSLLFLVGAITTGYSQFTIISDPVAFTTYGEAHETDIEYEIHIVNTSDEMASFFWSKRQISRYFKNRFGLSLKAYCNILRYRASFQQLKEQQLYPEQDYADQAHFIRDVKKYSGVTPKKLAENKNGRFIQLSTLSEP